MKLKLRPLKTEHWPAPAGGSEGAGDEADSACVKKATNCSATATERDCRH